MQNHVSNITLSTTFINKCSLEELILRKGRIKSQSAHKDVVDASNLTRTTYASVFACKLSVNTQDHLSNRII